MHRILTTLGLLISYVLTAADPDGIVRGKVSDKNTGEPLAGVYIIYGKALGTTTGQDGDYFIKTNAGKLHIRFQFIGYGSVTREVTLTDNETLSLDVSLEMMVREIDQIVVSANRNEQKIAELSVSMDIIKSTFLSDNHINDAQELINKIPGIEVMDGQASVRGGSGFSYGAGSRVLALIDGLPMVSADAGNIKWQFLPLENLSQIEIIKGASSVLYGSSALNGVINFRTADATNTPVTKFFIETGIFDKPKNKARIWWDTPRTFSNASFSHLQKYGKTDFGISGNFLIDDGYRRFNGEKLVRLSLKLKHFNSKIEGLTYGINLNSGYTVKKDFLLWEDADSGALKQDWSTASEFHGTFITFDPFISFRQTDKFRHDLKVRLQSSLNRLPNNPDNNSDAISFYTEYQLWYKLSDFMDFTAGASENYSKVNSARFFGNHTSLNIAGFTQLEVRPLNRLKGVAGIRVENNSLDGINDKIIPVFRAGLNWQAADYTFIRASFGQGYRYPSIAEKFAATTLGSIKIIENPDILAESGWSTELGAKQGLSFGKLSGQFDIALFYMRNTNLIEYMFASYLDEGMGFKANNSEEARIYGTELEFLLSGETNKIKYAFSGGYSFIYPIDLKPFTSLPLNNFLKYRRMHSGKISYNAEWKNFDLDLNFYLKSKILNIDRVFLEQPILVGFTEYWEGHNTGYALLDGSLGYKISVKYTLSLAVKNITNTEYMGRPGDIQPQRNFSVRFSGEF
ncbi:MAG: TonB-dependent receptor [Bacteroidales bacterium]|jgi:iron complex outermembrane receptor protein|nr:TonB-dependent receptor [Bacteroidales bacterium]